MVTSLAQRRPTFHLLDNHHITLVSFEANIDQSLEYDNGTKKLLETSCKTRKMPLKLYARYTNVQGSFHHVLTLSRASQTFSTIRSLLVTSTGTAVPATANRWRSVSFRRMGKAIEAAAQTEAISMGAPCILLNIELLTSIATTYRPPVGW